ncbi:hypothetical protein Rrhod_1634 [Rhodococcus rhodnii LMG 5362]|uniref:DUF3558 domain-containing protein n=2 Tax=Rhodococcus rhodnii TaxID=38312 RepID=R7WP14_9NOCA|nr:hypothetical protein Rrhod_1634 [Rhodococcus rhodnii LMG 5362]
MSDRPHVTFDPCHHLGDEVMRSAGYDPGTKESTDFLADSYTTLGCMWKTDPRQYRITVLSSNFTADEQRERFSEHTTSIPVAGSEAIRLIDPDMPDECADIVATEFGAVLINRLDQNLMTGGATPEQRCAGMDETVEIILDAMNAPR